MSNCRIFGWYPDLPDHRDLTFDSSVIQAQLMKFDIFKKVAKAKALPSKVDVRQWCSTIENQGQLGACTAHAGVGCLEYYENKFNGKYIDASRLFLYKATRDILGKTGDSGATARATMKAMSQFGVPPEKYWPYDITKFDEEPPAFCYAKAANYKALKYYKLDTVRTDTEKTLQNIKTVLASEHTCMFGFTVFSSIPHPGAGSDIPFPNSSDSVLGGHAVMIVGYDDDHKTVGAKKGAFLIRNSWGVEWGDKGYGWLPYSYVEEGLALDFWSLIQAEVE